MSDVNDVLAANDRFYQAFGAGDFAAMTAIWTTGGIASCIHPGWPPVRGREKVMETWRHILMEPPKPAIRPLEADALIHGDSAVVVCYEAIGRIYLSASNVFIREADGWRLVHHQSGQSEKVPKSVMEQSDKTIH